MFAEKLKNRIVQTPAGFVPSMIANIIDKETLCSVYVEKKETGLTTYSDTTKKVRVF